MYVSRGRDKGIKSVKFQNKQFANVGEITGKSDQLGSEIMEMKKVMGNLVAV